MFIGIPIILIWVVGFPLYIFIQLYKARKHLKRKEIILTYGLFLVGLKDDSYFWEIAISNLRKIIFVMCGTIISSSNSHEKVIYDFNMF
jgi:hypothetical protein